MKLSIIKSKVMDLNPTSSVTIKNNIAVFHYIDEENKRKIKTVKYKSLDIDIEPTSKNDNYNIGTMNNYTYLYFKLDNGRYINVYFKNK